MAVREALVGIPRVDAVPPPICVSTFVQSVSVSKVPLTIRFPAGTSASFSTLREKA